MEAIETMNKDLLRIPITLQRRTMLQISAMLWQRQDISNNLEHILEHISKLTPDKRYVMRMTSSFRNEKWCQLTEKVVRQSDLLNLPASVAAQLSEFIIFMGEKIYFMAVEMLRDGIKFKSKFFDNIFFTNEGLIDKCKMYQEWKKDPFFPDFSGEKYMNVMISSSMACLYGDFDFLRQGDLEKVVSAIRGVLGFNIIINSWDRAIAILLIWKLFYSSPIGEMRFNTVYTNLFGNPNYRDGEDQLFLHSVTYGYEKAAEYFFRKLNEVDKENMLVSAATECMTHYKIKLDHFQEVSENQVGITFYVMEKMSDEEKKKFLCDYVSVIYLISIKRWPYVHLCRELLEYVWEDLSESDKSPLLKICFEQFYSCPSFHYHNIFRPMYQSILEFLMPRIPGNLKFEIFNESCRFRKPRIGLFELFKKSDFSSLRMIMNDPDLSQHRDELIDLSQHLPEYILKENDFESITTKVNTYLQVLRFSPNERAKFFEIFHRIDISEKIVLHGKFSALSQILKWLYDSDEEGIQNRLIVIRNSLNPEAVYSNFIAKGEYAACERYLQWQFVGRDQALENFRTLISSNKFICEQFWSKWIKKFISNNFHSTIPNFECYKLLEHFLPSRDQVDMFKREIILENSVRGFCDCLIKIGVDIGEEQPRRHMIIYRDGGRETRDNTLPKLSDWKRMTEFKIFDSALNGALYFCSLKFNEIDTIKQSIKDNIDEWLTLYGIDRCELLVLNALIHWLRCSEYEKRRFIKRFIESRQGAMLCLKVFSRAHLRERDPAQTILADWIRKYADIDRVKQEIRLLNVVEGLEIAMQNLDRAHAL